MVTLACPPIHVPLTMVAVTTSVASPVSLVCAAVDLATSLLPMVHLVLRMPTSVLAMVAKVTVSMLAPASLVHKCAAAPLAINCSQMESHVKVSKYNNINFLCLFMRYYHDFILL